MKRYTYAWNKEINRIRQGNKPAIRKTPEQISAEFRAALAREAAKLAANRKD